MKAPPAAAERVVVLEGDWGGQIYLVVPARLVACGDTALERLLRDLDGLAWPGNPAGAAQVRIESLPVGATVAGGMGGGQVTDGVWIHPELAPHESAVREVVAGRRERLGEA